MELSVEALRDMYNFVKKHQINFAIENINHIILYIFSSKCMICLEHLVRTSKQGIQVSSLILKDTKVSAHRTFKHLICPDCYVNNQIGFFSE